MGIVEVILVILGIIVFIVSFLLPAGKTDSGQGTATVNEEDIHKMLEKEVTGVKSQISEIADETITYSMEKTERTMERLTNEKMMAINEYSDTVLSEINKNHKEVVFLYDMLNDKHENLLSTVSEASKTASEIKQAVTDVEVSAKEAQEKVRAVQESVSEVMNLAKNRTMETPASAGKEIFAVPAGEVQRIQEEEDGFLPIDPLRVEIIGNPSDDYAVNAGDNAVGKDAFFPDGETAEPDMLKKKSRKPRTVKREVSGDNGAGAAVSRVSLSADEVPEIAVAAHAAESGSRNNNERILELHRAGKSNMAIAKELGLGIGEVKLVIDLFKGI